MKKNRHTLSILLLAIGVIDCHDTIFDRINQQMDESIKSIQSALRIGSENTESEIQVSFDKNSSTLQMTLPNVLDKEDIEFYLYPKEKKKRVEIKADKNGISFFIEFLPNSYSVTASFQNHQTRDDKKGYQKASSSSYVSHQGVIEKTVDLENITVNLDSKTEKKSLLTIYIPQKDKPINRERKEVTGNKK